jgi:two-component sensor histidine kinase
MSAPSATSPIHFRSLVDTTADSRLMEADHRIANSLAMVTGLIRLQARDVASRAGPMTGAEAGRLLDETAVRIDAVGRWHRLLAQFNDRDHIEAGDYLREVCEAAVASLARPGTVALRTDLDAGCILTVPQVAPLAMFVSEALTNAIKYAHPAGVRGIVSVACRISDTDGRLRLTITDDGVGLPADFDPKTGGGLGFRVMRSLARQLDGKLTFNSTELGLRVALSLPAAVNDD